MSTAFEFRPHKYLVTLSVCYSNGEVQKAWIEYHSPHGEFVDGVKQDAENKARKYFDAVAVIVLAATKIEVD